MSLWLADAEPSYDTLEAEPDYVDWSQPGRRTTGKSEQRERGSTASSRSPDRRATQSAGKTFNIDQDSNGSFLWRKPDQSFTLARIWLVEGEVLIPIGKPKQIKLVRVSNTVLLGVQSQGIKKPMFP